MSEYFPKVQPPDAWIQEQQDGSLLVLNPATLDSLSLRPWYVENDYSEGFHYLDGSGNRFSLSIDVGTLASAADLGDASDFEARVQEADLYATDVNSWVENTRPEYAARINALRKRKPVFSYGYDNGVDDARTQGVYAGIQEVINDFKTAALCHKMDDEIDKANIAEDKAFAAQLALYTHFQWVAAGRFGEGLFTAMAHHIELATKPKVEIYAHADRVLFGSLPHALHASGLKNIRRQKLEDGLSPGNKIDFQHAAEIGKLTAQDRHAA